MNSSDHFCLPKKRYKFIFIFISMYSNLFYIYIIQTDRTYVKYSIK